MKKMILAVVLALSASATLYRPGGVSSIGPVRETAPKTSTSAFEPIPVPTATPQPGRHCPPGPNCCNWMCRA